MSEPSVGLEERLRVEVGAERQGGRVAEQGLDVLGERQPVSASSSSSSVVEVLAAAEVGAVDLEQVAEPALAEADADRGRGVRRAGSRWCRRRRRSPSRSLPAMSPSPANSSSTAPSSKRSTPAMPSKSSQLLLELVADSDSVGPPTSPRRSRRRAELARRTTSLDRAGARDAHSADAAAEREPEQVVGVLGEVVAERRRGVHRHDAGVAGLADPLLEVLVVGQRRRPRRRRRRPRRSRRSRRSPPSRPRSTQPPSLLAAPQSLIASGPSRRRRRP